MNAVRGALLGLSLTVVFGIGDAAGQAQKKGQGMISPLVPEAVIDQLDLAAAQKEKYAKLQDEFAVRVRQTRAGLAADLKKAKAAKDKAAMKRLAASMKLAVDEHRRALEPRFEEILTPEQKKKYQELKKNAPVGGKKPGRKETPPETVKGTLQRLDPDKGTLVLTMDGKTETYTVSRATKVLDAAGAELPGGLTDKALAPGAEVAVTTSKPSATARRLNVLELRLVDKK